MPLEDAWKFDAGRFTLKIRNINIIRWNDVIVENLPEKLSIEILKRPFF